MAISLKFSSRQILHHLGRMTPEQRSHIRVCDLARTCQIHRHTARSGLRQLTGSGLITIHSSDWRGGCPGFYLSISLTRDGEELFLSDA